MLKNPSELSTLNKSECNKLWLDHIATLTGIDYCPADGPPHLLVALSPVSEGSRRERSSSAVGVEGGESTGSKVPSDRLLKEKVRHEADCISQSQPDTTSSCNPAQKRRRPSPAIFPSRPLQLQQFRNIRDDHPVRVEASTGKIQLPTRSKWPVVRGLIMANPTETFNGKPASNRGRQTLHL